MAEDQWVLLVDPAWEPESTEDDAEVSAPPTKAVVGGWLPSADDSFPVFEANLDYEPAGPDSPTDAVDAVLRLSAHEAADFESVATVFLGFEFSLAVGEDNEPIVAPSPDDVPCLLVTTAPVHRTLVQAAGWVPASADDLAELLEQRDGTDLLVNPGAPGCSRVPAETVQAISSL